MRFSEAFNITRDQDDDWFDPLLHTDTMLFVDPFLLAEDRDPAWVASHDRLVAFFNEALKLMARAGLSPHSAHWRKASWLLLFPEPAEFCLGYSVDSTGGLGSGEKLRQAMMYNAAEAIRVGLDHVEHFEELTLFGEQIGADRISDITCNVLKAEFIRYTQQVAERHGVRMEEVNVRNARWSDHRLRWVDEVVTLPRNPINARAVLLVPERFLRELPTVEPAEFWDWAWTNENQRLRDEFNYEVGARVDRREIARLARRRPFLVRQFMRYREQRPKRAYDVENDPLFRVRWYERGREVAWALALSHPAPQGPADFVEFVRSMVEAFRREIEQRGGWRVLWFGDRCAGEKNVQAFFNAVVVHYCRANDVRLSPETNAGRGAVDFEFSRGWKATAIVEIKLANNSSYWHGVMVQTPEYMQSGEAMCGFFVTIQYREQDLQSDRIERVRAAAAQLAVDLGTGFEAVFVDATRKVSASKM